MFTANFWKQSAERAVKTAAQAMLGLWALDGGFNVVNADWQMAAGFAAGAALLSLLTSIVTSGIGQPNDPSMVAKDPSIADTGARLA